VKTQSISAYGPRSASDTSASRTQWATSGQVDRPLSQSRPPNSRNADPDLGTSELMANADEVLDKRTLSSKVVILCVRE